jgi:hypothetical protein
MTALTLRDRVVEVLQAAGATEEMVAGVVVVFGEFGDSPGVVDPTCVLHISYLRGLQRGRMGYGAGRQAVASGSYPAADWASAGEAEMS